MKGSSKKITYERRTYESVDEKSLSYRLCREKTRKKLVLKGLTKKTIYRILDISVPNRERLFMSIKLNPVESIPKRIEENPKNCE